MKTLLTTLMLATSLVLALTQPVFAAEKMGEFHCSIPKKEHHSVKAEVYGSFDADGEPVFEYADVRLELFSLETQETYLVKRWDRVPLVSFKRPVHTFANGALKLEAGADDSTATSKISFDSKSWAMNCFFDLAGN